MKICPKCKKEFEDSLNFCTEDHTELEAIDSQEENALSEDEIPVIEEISATEESDEDIEEEIEASALEDDLKMMLKTRNCRKKKFRIHLPQSHGKAAAAQSGSMSAMAKGLIVFAVIFVIGGGLVFWKAKYRRTWSC